MIGCYQIKKQIDETDRPDMLSYEANLHIASCRDCSEFAEGRARLRELLAQGSRVTVPANFDAVLRARLKERNARRALAWLDATLLWRGGAVTAALILVVAGAQYAGFFTGSNQTSSSVQTNIAAGGPINEATHSRVAGKEATTSEPGKLVAPQTENRQVTTTASLPARYGTASRRLRQTEHEASRPSRLSAADMPVVLVVARDGEIEVPMPTVSVGAQPLLYVNAGRQTAQNVKTTF